MPTDTLSFMQRLQEYGILGYAWLLILSVWAGTARYLGSLNGQKPTLWGWLTETCVCAFVGIVTAAICQYYSVDYILTSAIVAISAHNGTRSLYVISKIIKKNAVIPVQVKYSSSMRLARRKDDGHKGN